MKNKIWLFTLCLLILAACTKAVPEEEPPIAPPDEIETLQVNVNLAGKDYVLPVAYHSLAEDGWVPTFSIDDSIAPHSFVRGFSLRKDRYIIKVAFYNASDETKNLSEVLIAELEAENRKSYYDDPVDITVLGSIDFKSSPDDIATLLKIEPSLETSAIYQSYTFTLSDLAELIVRYDLETKEMQWIVVNHFANE